MNSNLVLVFYTKPCGFDVRFRPHQFKAIKNLTPSNIEKNDFGVKKAHEEDIT
jgi:hypothetical protein